jgi:two-component system, cell cycle sensor histidine kinase and response regulator CckA
MTSFGRFQQSEAVLRALLESPQHIVIFALDRQYCYLAYNQNHARTMKQIWGVEIAVGMNMLALIGRHDDRAKARANFDRALAGESLTLLEEYGDTRMERRAYEDVYSPVHNDEGRIIGVAVYVTDITEHRRATFELERYRGHLEELVAQRTRELEAAHMQLLHAQKLESLGVLAGGIAHDFNNLLAVVLTRAELGLRDLHESAPARLHAAIIRDTALEARTLTKQLLSYAGKGKLVIETVRLNDVVQSIAQLLRASTSKGIRMEFTLAEPSVVVQGDTTQLRQVLLNLVTNAAEAIGAAAGMISIRTGMLELAGDALGEACFPGDLLLGRYACLEVEDDGIGIGDDVKAKLFDPFFTTKFAGRGLGLAAVLGIVKSHRGTILLRTSPGLGSRFRVLLPEADGGFLNELTPVATPATPFIGRGTALVVDDEVAVREVTSALLAALGYRVLEADGGLGARERFLRHAEEVDVVLLDFAMPDMDGEQTLRELKKIRADVPVILLTAYAEDELRARFEPGDLAGFIAKPFARDELVEALRKAQRR